MNRERRRGDFSISTDPKRLDVAMIHSFLTTSYWAEGIPMEIVKRSIERSLAFGMFKGNEQIGFARVITDYATFAYIGDVFVLEHFRGQGLGKWLMGVIVTHPELQGLRKWLLATRDAHGLYRQVGFTQLRHPERVMERSFPASEVYRKKNHSSLR
jgi:GNAT superfamily N-acetyltransferase